MKDNDIIELFWQRDESAITETDRKYGNYCRKIAVNLLGNNEDAEECVSDTYLRTWNSIPELRPKCFQGFLAQITRRLSIDRWKRMSAEKRGGGNTTLVLDELEECVSGSESAEKEYEVRQLSEAVDCFIKGLPEKEQRMFVWRYFYAMPVQDIAKGLGMKAGNVSVLLSRIRGRLKEYLQREGYEL